jgi:hypothetical protein
MQSYKLRRHDDPFNSVARKHAKKILFVHCPFIVVGAIIIFLEPFFFQNHFFKMSTRQYWFQAVSTSDFVTNKPFVLSIVCSNGDHFHVPLKVSVDPIKRKVNQIQPAEKVWVGKNSSSRIDLEPPLHTDTMLSLWPEDTMNAFFYHVETKGGSRGKQQYLLLEKDKRYILEVPSNAHGVFSITLKQGREVIPIPHGPHSALPPWQPDQFFDWGHHVLPLDEDEYFCVNVTSK